MPYADRRVTLGELHRVLLEIKKDHGEKLAAIEAQSRIANGRTGKLETWAARMDERVGGMDRHNEQQDKVQSTAPDLSGDIRIPINAKTIAAILSALAALIVAYLTVRAGG